MSAAAEPDWRASSLTSPATTAKPRPASPARAASMVALRARRLVRPAMLVMVARMPLIASLVVEHSRLRRRSDVCPSARCLS
jgi:hypothetical protein